MPLFWVKWNMVTYFFIHHLLNCVEIEHNGKIHFKLMKTDHVERKVPKYENHKLRERKVKTLTRN